MVFWRIPPLQQLPQGIALSSIGLSRLWFGKSQPCRPFVLEKGCGIAVESLHDLKETIDNLSDADYQDLVDNAKRVGQEIREGHYLKTALKHLA